MKTKNSNKSQSVTDNKISGTNILKSSTLGMAAGITILSGTSAADTTANNKVNLALIGCGGRGRGVIGGFHARNDTNILYCCDVNKQRGESTASNFNAKYAEDMRTVFDDKSVDAVICATPDHWHALCTFWAVKAGKDVYVEKPVSRDGFEGQKCVEAARKYKRIVQHGTQNRSAPYNIAAKKYITDGRLGDIHLCRVYNIKRWGGLQIKKGEKIPEGFNYDLWLGPVPNREYSSSIVHSGWHQLWDFSGGDMADDGVHQLDLARWLVGKEIPKSAYAVGGVFSRQDDSQTPDTLVSTYEYDNLTFTFELALYPDYMLKIGDRNSDIFPLWMSCATRIEIFGTKGLMVVGRHGGGWQVFDRPYYRAPVVKAEHHGRVPENEHFENFIQCIRSRSIEDLNADIEKAHRSAMLVHYATMSLLTGSSKLEINQKDGTIINNPAAMKLWKHEYRKPFEITDEV
ncbi:MAG: Gfo/Idh/MocA family oxidoreductase [Planctomycetaceae bacterium]|jgi:predicted dehydrogenase|nr:Gfo/Idh/MocA family oxidoreductase [Planctomycetaceae bacterium]